MRGLSNIKAKMPENTGNINLYGQICLGINSYN